MMRCVIGYFDTPLLRSEGPSLRISWDSWEFYLPEEVLLSFNCNF